MEQQYDFASDNTAGICPEALSALLEANCHPVASYGEDDWTERLCDRVRELFEKECESFLVFNGTAANALALSQLCHPFECVLCHEFAHIMTDECGAPEFFSGGAKLLPVGGAAGKIDLAQAEIILKRQADVHSSKPRAISVTQATEAGTVYRREELEEIAGFARRHCLAVHMDGARFANAVASIGCRPKEITWEVGVDVLALGGTKNGLAAGELVVFFNRELARDFQYRAKQAGQLASKMRFLSAPWLALLSDDTWLRNARHANDSAELLLRKLVAAGAPGSVFPRESNALFLNLPAEVVDRLRDHGWHFGNFFQPDLYRIMCSWAVTRERIDGFVEEFQRAGLDRSH